MRLSYENAQNYSPRFRSGKEVRAARKERAAQFKLGAELALLYEQRLWDEQIMLALDIVRRFEMAEIPAYSSVLDVQVPFVTDEYGLGHDGNW